MSSSKKWHNTLSVTSGRFGMYLSLIVPFYNSAHKCKRLLERISEIISSNLEVILVDDGSTDDTYRLLTDFRDNLPQANITVIKQKNKGPGGARNTGLKRANGEYVWFIDSDDDITLEALAYIKSNCANQYDFIDFNVVSSDGIPINRMGVLAGSYRDRQEISSLLFSKFLSQTCKAFRRNFLIENQVHYPEYCYYEDIPMAFTLPLLVTSFLKTDIVGYLYHQEFASITRGKITLKSLDRLYTSTRGLKEGLALAKTDIEIDIIKQRFIQLYLIDSAEMFFSVMPNKGWVSIWRIMSEYRRLAKQFNISLTPFPLINEKDYQYKIYFQVQWLMSFMITGNQAAYFARIRKKAWGL